MSAVIATNNNWDRDKYKIIFVEVMDEKSDTIVAQYWVDHNDPKQRAVLGEQCRNAFDGGQSVYTCPVNLFGQFPPEGDNA